MKVVSTLLALAVALTIVGKLSADDKACPTTKPKEHVMGMPWDVLKGLNLSDDQKTEVKELRKEYGPKFKAAADSVLTTDQKKARKDAVSAAKAEGKKPHEVMKAGIQAVKLSDDQKAKLKEVVKPLDKEVREKLMAILTPEQKEQLKQKCEKHKASK